MSTKFDWTTGPLAEGLHCYRTQQFFEAHEHWETIWLTLSEPEKSFLQALVQLSAAFHHQRQGNRIGAISLLTRSLGRLDRCPAQFCNLNLRALRADARVWLGAMEAEGAELPIAYPGFEIANQQ